MTIRFPSKPLVLVVSQRQIDAEEYSLLFFNWDKGLSLWQQNRKIYPHAQTKAVEILKEITEPEFIMSQVCSIVDANVPLTC